MKFVLDLQVLQSESKSRGIGRYSRGLAQALLCGPHGRDASVIFNLAVTEGLEQRQHAAQKSISSSPKAEVNFWNQFDELRSLVAGCRKGIPISCFRGLPGVAAMLSPPETKTTAANALYDGYLASLETDIIHIPSV